MLKLTFHLVARELWKNFTRGEETERTKNKWFVGWRKTKAQGKNVYGQNRKPNKVLTVFSLPVGGDWISSWKRTIKEPRGFRQSYWGK